jgi:hypothetical protein
MADWPLPPSIEPHGRLDTDDAVARAFVRNEVPPYSERLHVEPNVLLVNRDVPAALRIGPRTFLTRLDLPDDLDWARSLVEDVARSEGFRLVDHENALAISIAMQMVALRLSTWDVWGSDPEEAFADVNTAAVGGEGDILLGGGGPPVGF